MEPVRTMKLYIYIGEEPRVSVSIGGKSMIVERGQPIEIPDDFSLNNSNFVPAEEKPQAKKKEK